MKLWRLPKGSIMKYIVLPLWPTYISERRTPFSKAYGIKVRWYEEHVDKKITKLGNILGTHWELERNIVQTHWETKKNEKKISPTPPPPLKHKRKKARHLECMIGPSHWLHEISLPKRLGHHFWPGLTALAKNTLPIECWGTFDLKIELPGFSNISDPENCLFWIDQNLKRIARFQRRMGDYLTNSNSPTTKVERFRNRNR
jgi:hypothetical protein